MIITDRFVMLNFPKTGSSFARSVIKELHRPTLLQRTFPKLARPVSPVTEVMMIPWGFRSFKRPPDQHGMYSQIPMEHRGKEIMTIVRDPIERIVSEYEFKRWPDAMASREAELKARYPHFPDLSFEEYFDIRYRRPEHERMEEIRGLRIGPETLLFINFFSIDPPTTVKAMHQGIDVVAERDRFFPSIRFLHTERLRDDLTGFLAGMGYSRSRLAFIQRKPKVNVTDRSGKAHFTPEMLEHVLYMERYLFQWLPEYHPTATPH